MFNATKSLIIAAGIMLGATGFSAAEAGSRHDRGVTFGTPGFSITIGEGLSYRDGRPASRRDGNLHRDFRRYDRGNRDFRRGDRRDRGYRRPRVCTAERALDEVRSRGIRRAHIRRMNDRMIVVAGRARGERVLVGFGRERSCPVRFVRAR